MSYFRATVSRIALGTLANAALIGIGAVVAGTGLALTAVTLLEYVEMTPEMRELTCFLGSEHPDCPSFGAELQSLRDEMHATRREYDRLARDRAGLAAIEASVDEITLFEGFTAPDSGRAVTVGTTYRALVGDDPRPLSYYCYVNLGNGPFGEARNLHFRNSLGFKDIDDATLRAADVTPATLEYARSVCDPFIIGEHQ